MRSRVLWAVLATALALPSANAATAQSPLATPDGVVRGFVDGLRHASYTDLWPYTDIDVAAVWDGVDELLERYTCVDIARWSYTKTRLSDDRVRADIHLDGTRTKANGTVDPLPDVVVTLERIGGGWTIVECQTAVDFAGTELRVANGDADRECVLERTRLDRGAIIRSAAEYVDKDSGEPLLTFAADWAYAHHDVVTESQCSRMRAFIRNRTRGDAVAWADYAMELAQQAGDGDALAKALFMRGLQYWRGGHSRRAIADLEAVAGFLPKLHDTHIGLKSLYMSGYIDVEQGDYRRALLVGERLQQLAKEDGWDQGVALAMWQVGDIQDALRNFDVARQYHANVYATMLGLGRLNMAERAIADVAFDEMNLGHFERADSLFAAVPWAMTDKYIVAQMVASFMTRHRDDALASLLDRIDPKLAEGDPAIMSQLAVARATLSYHRKRYVVAEAEARSALRTAVAPGSTVHWPPWPAQLLLGRALQGENRADEAEAAYRDAITTIEHESDTVPGDALGRLRYFGDKIEPYRALAELQARRGNGSGALTVAESVRARALREVLDEGKIDLRRDLTDDERKREKELEEEVSTLGRKFLTAPATEAPAMRRDVERARVALADFQAQLGVRHAALRTTVRPRISDVTAAASGLRPGELVVEYMVGPERTIAFLITRDGTTVRFLPATQAMLDALAQRFTSALSRRDMRYARTSRAIYDAVIAPLEPELSQHHDLCIVPDGALWRVPFEALLDARGAFLIDRATISYAPSLLILGDTRRAHRPDDLHPLLAFGNPSVDGRAAARVRSIERGATLGALPEAADEVTRIGAMYGRGSEVFVGETARETTLKTSAPRFRIIHIAAHGFVEDRSPLYSCVVLAPDKENDGLLEMREVADLKLNADLVVLSSCDTARGKIAPGEGVVGLAWAFLAAGCPSTVVSQWKVDSAATEQLMVDFHRRLLAHGLRGKAEALRRAKLALRHDPRYRHPYYWAPFIVVGDGS